MAIHGFSGVLPAGEVPTWRYAGQYLKFSHDYVSLEVEHELESDLLAHMDAVLKGTITFEHFATWVNSLDCSQLRASVSPAYRVIGHFQWYLFHMHEHEGVVRYTEEHVLTCIGDYWDWMSIGMNMKLEQDDVERHRRMKQTALDLLSGEENQNAQKRLILFDDIIERIHRVLFGWLDHRIFLDGWLSQPSILWEVVIAGRENETFNQFVIGLQAIWHLSHQGDSARETKQRLSDLLTRYDLLLVDTHTEVQRPITLPSPPDPTT